MSRLDAGMCHRVWWMISLSNDTKRKGGLHGRQQQYPRQITGLLQDAYRDGDDSPRINTTGASMILRRIAPNV
jgi:hypothetical protein